MILCTFTINKSVGGFSTLEILNYLLSYWAVAFLWLHNIISLLYCMNLSVTLRKGLILDFPIMMKFYTNVHISCRIWKGLCVVGRIFLLFINSFKFRIWSSLLLEFPYHSYIIWLNFWFIYLFKLNQT